MRKEYRIKKNEEFQEVFKNGRSIANRQFVLYMLKKQEQTHFRIGLSVSKKMGNAVVRNQIKRYIRQVFHELDSEVHQAYDYIIIARKPAASMGYFEMKKSLMHILRLARVLKVSKNGQNGK